MPKVRVGVRVVVVSRPPHVDVGRGIHVRWATHNDDSNAAPGSDLGIDSSGVPRHLALGHARQHVQV